MKRRLMLASAAALAAPALRAQAWPSRPLHIIVPRAPGGAIDLVGRLITDALAARIGQPVVVEAKPGANGMIGAAVVARAAPDGYTWLLATTNHVVAPLLNAASYHPVADFSAVARLGSFSSIAVVRASLPVNSMAELISYARANPGRLNYLNSGTGSTMHLNTELFKLRQGIDLVSIQYRGMQNGIHDLLAGRVDFAFTVPSLVTQHIRSGALRALAVVGTSRQSELPGVPTLQEIGLQDIHLDAWFAVVGPASVPEQIIQALHQNIAAVLDQPELQRLLVANSLDSMPPVTPAELHKLLQADYERYETLIRTAGIKSDS